jgi:TetR/AcrR family transcriptional regulator, copper-responsive repressor
VQDDRSVPAAAPPRGRPRSFDLDAATAAALRALWTKGYEATTVEDLVEATGLSTSSLYAAFGSKHGVLQAALARYDRDRDDLLGPLERGTEGLDDLRGFLDRVRQGVTDPGSPGCFMVNTATEVAPRDGRIAEHAHRYRERVRDAVADTLRRATDRGELPPMGSEEILGRARLLQAALYGAQVAARSRASREALATVDAVERQVEQWATASSPARPAAGA